MGGRLRLGELDRDVSCRACARSGSRKSGAPEAVRVYAADRGAQLCRACSIHDKNLLLIPELFYGISWAAIVGLPYAILSVALPPERTGVYMGIFNFFIVLPQLAYSAIMPFVIKYLFHENPIPTIFLAGACFFIAAILGLRVKEVEPMSALEPAV